MKNDFTPPHDLIDYLEGLPIKIIEDIDSYELIQKNTILGILDTTLDDEVKKLTAALPNLKITPIRGIGTQTISSNAINLKFKIFNTLGYHFSDGTELAICSNGNNSIEIVSFKISTKNKNKGLDVVIMDFLLSYLHLSLLHIPTIYVMVKNNKPYTDSQIQFFKKFGFHQNEQKDDYYLLKRKEEQFIIN